VLDGIFSGWTQQSGYPRPHAVNLEAIDPMRLSNPRHLIRRLGRRPQFILQPVLTMPACVTRSAIRAVDPLVAATRSPDGERTIFSVMAARYDALALADRFDRVAARSV
jgi:hypothetical protein